MVKLRCLSSVAVLLILAAPAGAIKKPRHRIAKLSTGVYLAAEFDAATTYHALQNCRTGCYEANPLVRPFAHNPGIFVALGVSAYAVNYFAGRLKAHGHAKWATALQVIAIGSHAGAGVQALALAR